KTARERPSVAGSGESATGRPRLAKAGADTQRGGPDRHLATSALVGRWRYALSCLGPTAGTLPPTCATRCRSGAGETGEIQYSYLATGQRVARSLVGGIERSHRSGASPDTSRKPGG